MENHKDIKSGFASQKENEKKLVKNLNQKKIPMIKLDKSVIQGS